MELADSQIDCEYAILVCHSNAICAIGRPCKVDWSISHGLVSVVNQPRLDGGVLTTIEPWNVVQLEVRRTYDRDVDVSPGWCEYGSLVPSEIIVRVGEIGSDPEYTCRVLRVPSPVVVKCRLSVNHLRYASIAGLR